MDFNEVVEQRRSVRKYKESSCSQEKILSILDFVKENAPSWKNSQTHRYFAVFSKEKMAEIEKTLHFINQGKCENAVALIVSGFEKNISGFTLKIADNECGNLWGAYDLGLSDSLLILKAKEQNLDTLIMGLRDSEKIRKILNIPENIQIMSVISVGERKESEIKKPPKKSFDEVVFKY